MKNLFTLLLVVIIGTGTATFSQTVTIGTQEWMTKNLDVSTFRNGDPIPEAKTNEEWKKAGEVGQPAWCYYDNDPANGANYGKLYNWYAVNDSRGLAPEGYRIPSFIDFDKLVTKNVIDDSTFRVFKSIHDWDSILIEEKIEKCSNCVQWSPRKRKKDICVKCENSLSYVIPSTMVNNNGSNKTGFNAFPSGFRGYKGVFALKNYSTIFITLDETNCESCGIDTKKDHFRAFVLTKNFKFEYFHNGKLEFYEGEVEIYPKEYGYSIRCIKD
jgi:hypothetical protein